MARKSKQADSPWLADAAAGATGESYEIRTVSDFLKVPVERRYICLREFSAWLEIGEKVAALHAAVAKSMGQTGWVLKPRTEVYVWHDDGKATASAVIVNAGAEVLEAPCPD